MLLNTSHIEIFTIPYTVCYMHGLAIYEINRICHRAQFFKILYRIDQFSELILS